MLRFRTFVIFRGSYVVGSLKKKHRIIAINPGYMSDAVQVHTVGEDEAEDVSVRFTFIPDFSTIEKDDLAKLAYIGTVLIENQRYYVFANLAQMREHGIDRA
jgi:hypothetical protein